MSIIFEYCEDTVYRNKKHDTGEGRDQSHPTIHLKIVSPFKQIKPRVGAGGVCRCHVRMKECCFYFDTQLRLLLLEIREPKMKRALRVMR